MFYTNKLIQLLCDHYEKYPNMQIDDMYKLIYQNEFAGGHLITNENESLCHLTNEFYKIKDKHYSNCVSEDIGNGLSRLYLTALSDSEIKISTINKFFINTANSHKGNVKNFENKLAVLLECCKQNILPFDYNEASGFINHCKDEGYLHISHSEKYRKCYRPSYRVIKNEFIEYFEVFSKVDDLSKTKNNITIAIDGSSGAGKSTLAVLIEQIYDCNVIHMDHFFLPPDLKTKERLLEVGGNIDYVRFFDEVIRGVRSRKQFSYQGYDCSTMTFEKNITFQPKELNVIEGVYSMHPKFIQQYDLKVFLQVNKEQQSKRILKRNGEELYKKFINEWIPMENRYFAQMQIKEKSDLVYEF